MGFQITFQVLKETISATVSTTLQAGGCAEPKIGDKMPDGTVYAGLSPETNQPMYTTPADAPLTMKFNKARKYAAKLDAHRHRDWRVPTKAELDVLFNNRAAIGGFDLSGLAPTGWYWSSGRGVIVGAWAQRFGTGFQYSLTRGDALSLRCVR